LFPQDSARKLQPPCLNCDLPAKTATSHCRLNRRRREFAPMNARFVLDALTRFWTTFVPIAEVDLCPGRFGVRKTGGATTISARIRPARLSGIAPLIRQPMQNSRRRFDRILRKVDNGCQPVETLLDSLRNRAGGNPNSRLKARLNAGSDS